MLESREQLLGSVNTERIRVDMLVMMTLLA